MRDKRNTKKIVKNVSNVLFVSLILLLIFNPGAKAWFLKQLLTVGLFKAQIKNNPPDVKTLPVNFSYEDERGNIISSTELKGKVVLINYWATWCPPCRAEMPSLSKLYNELKGDNRFVFLFLNEDENLNKAKDFLQSNHYSFPITIRAGSLPSEMFNGTLPTTVVLNKDGKIVMKHEGIGSYNSRAFIAQLKSLL